ncbi:transmembrane protein 268 isoform X1 [Vespula maculifrons]|uniref:Transmembrane protein 268 isoform X1 n=1 Tax=Vespula maculifrons TaxID=7453 RepID=A0ABD2BR90_VESMC
MGERAELLLLRYASRWARHFVRRRLDLVIDSQDRNRSIAGLSVPPRHCVSARCPCQFIEDHLKYKPRGKLTLSRSKYLKLKTHIHMWVCIFNYAIHKKAQEIKILLHKSKISFPNSKRYTFIIFCVRVWTKGAGTSCYISPLNQNFIKTIKCMILRYPPGFTWCAYLNDPMVRFDVLPTH